jgi:riboflavin biosynthesis pyrimidine reductase
MTLRRYEHVSGSNRAETRAVAAKLYAEGATVRHIAAELGRSYGFVHRILIEAGVTLRSRGARARAVDSEIPGQGALELETSSA